MSLWSFMDGSREFKLTRVERSVGSPLFELPSQTEVVYQLQGRLYGKQSGDRQWCFLSVPGGLVRGAFAALSEPGAELLSSGGKTVDAHVVVFYPEEIAIIGGLERLAGDRGKAFRYTLGRLHSGKPESWPGISRYWFFSVHSPELQALRRSYGLSSLPRGDRGFHIPVAIERIGVLGRGPAAKEVA